MFEHANLAATLVIHEHDHHVRTSSLKVSQVSGARIKTILIASTGQSVFGSSTLELVSSFLTRGHQDLPFKGKVSLF